MLSALLPKHLPAPLLLMSDSGLILPHCLLYSKAHI